jgi:hypothetical protein
MTARLPRPFSLREKAARAAMLQTITLDEPPTESIAF